MNGSQGWSENLNSALLACCWERGTVKRHDQKAGRGPAAGACRKEEGTGADRGDARSKGKRATRSEKRKKERQMEGGPEA